LYNFWDTPQLAAAKFIIFLFLLKKEDFVKGQLPELLKRKDKRKQKLFLY
jgi:hypothetical protein